MNNNYINYLIRKYLNKGIVIDTNLFILYLIGIYDRNLISEFKRTRAYSVNDFYILHKLVLNFREVITTPNVLTEVSNLLESLNRNKDYKLFQFLHKSLMSLKEEYIESMKVMETVCFQKFGLTDSTLSFLAENKFLILTDDLPFYHYLETQKLPAINFNHLRLL